MTESHLAEEVLLAQMLTLHGIAIEDQWRASILANMKAIGRAADLVMTMAIDETVEPAPVFQASVE